MKNVTKLYPGWDNTVPAVDHLNLVVEMGEVFGLLGVNGAGKSTTFNMITRSILATSGEIYMAGYNIDERFSDAKPHIGYCPQFSALFENLTVR